METFSLASFFGFAAPMWLAPTQVLPDVTIQPKEAISIATPYLAEHATVLHGTHQPAHKPLKTSIVKKYHWYYVQQSNYPAKSIQSYLQPAVKVHVQTGEVSLPTEQQPNSQPAAKKADE